MLWRRRNHDTAPVPPAADAAPRSPDDRAGLGRGLRTVIGLACAVVVAFGCARFAPIIGPTVLALVVTICVQPARVFLERLGFARSLASAVVIVIVLVVTVAFTAALVISLAQFATLFPQYSDQFADLEQSVANGLESLGVGPEQVAAVFATFDPGKIVGVVSGLIGSVFGFGFSTFLVLSLIVFMTLDAGWGHLIAGRLRPARPGLVEALVAYTVSVRRYMLVTALLGAAVAALDALALVVLGIPGALLWGLLAFITGFIPNIGYWIGLIPPAFLALLAFGWPTALAVIVVYAVINGVIQSGLQPHITGSAVSLNQTISFLSVVVWSALLGPLGAILALPLTLLVRALLVDANPDARWMRPALGDLSGVTPAKRRRPER
ncbi:putative PurR-regulated permease PerM [Curtobacterium sp. PhB130]|uniref:AI-2E family transporter n=1 Tax=Curtobacterium sp. PhB130 TaxID=2485178 RepID=UPI000F4B4101|nr:AI-2E family transporter [Curtobacterium sp. PhB130]ROS75170.1 putative PurR-regulated permease PerM [Curtobacterium sp. PhB130]TCK63795.1 putative PurR-regulated permease PerM [Curtobacterium sp. PhB136]